MDQSGVRTMKMWVYNTEFFHSFGKDLWLSPHEHNIEQQVHFVQSLESNDAYRVKNDILLKSKAPLCQYKVLIHLI